jgi:dTDP-4-dehydrorhamnose reductase
LNKLKKILVTGANGQLGSELNVLSNQFNDFEFIFADRHLFPLDSEIEITARFKSIAPDFVINCAAYTAVDKAEQEQEQANQINHLAIGILAKLCSEHNTKLIHISTDYVFDGSSPQAYQESATTNPQSVYGSTKLAGENSCIANCPESIIIRTSWVYSEFGNNFVKTMLRLMTERETIGVVNDQVGSPTYAHDLAVAIMSIVENPNWKSGIYNYSNEGEISWHQFALDIKEIANLNCEVNGIPSSSYPTPAKRPAFSLLDKTKIKTNYGLDVPNYKVSLRKMIAKL